MKITVNVKSNSRKTGVVKTTSGEYSVSVKEPPIEGKANEAIIKAIAGHFGVSRHQVKIILGKKSKRKIVEIK